MPNTDLRGSSYRNFELTTDKATLCQDACKADNQCLAWTYVHPGLQGASARGKFLLRLRHRAKRREVIGAGDATLRFAKRVLSPSQSARHGLAASACCR